MGWNSVGCGLQGDGTEAQVTWEDQQNINRFGRLNNRLHELHDEIKLAKVLKCRLLDPPLSPVVCVVCLLIRAPPIYQPLLDLLFSSTGIAFSLASLVQEPFAARRRAYMLMVSGVYLFFGYILLLLLLLCDYD